MASPASLKSLEISVNTLQEQLGQFIEQGDRERVKRVGKEVHGLIAYIATLDPHKIARLQTLQDSLEALKEEVEEEEDAPPFEISDSLIGSVNQSFTEPAPSFSTPSYAELLPTQEEIIEIAKTLHAAGKINDLVFKAVIMRSPLPKEEIQIDLPTPGEIAKIAQTLFDAGKISAKLFIASVSNAMRQI